MSICPLPMLRLADARPLLRNPDRGLRMEAYITLGEPPECYPGSAEDPYEKLLASIAKYEAESPTVAQLYVYLARYSEKPLDSAAFGQLGRMLALCRDKGLRALLRFAYQNESNPDADWPRVRGHLEQLGGWFRANAQLAEDTLSAVQAGIVGCWGEGHGNVRFKNKYIGSAFALLCGILPADVPVQLRNVDLMGKVPPLYNDRTGMHDDYLVGERNGPWSFFLGRDGPREKRLEERFSRSVNDGELPWGRAVYYDRPSGRPLDAMEAMPILLQAKQYALSTLSLEHNYREAGPGRLFTMARWRDELLSRARLEEAGLPYHPALLDENGNITAFEYIRCHLGYLLSITSYERDASTVRFTIQNHGLAAPLTLGALSLVIDGAEYPVGGYDRYALGSMRAAAYTVDLPENFDPARPHSVGIRLARRAGSLFCARFMNDTPFADGAQRMEEPACTE
ncbi:MAG: DUF4874 domain-containing protein [Firmicutes bacterium]|nr:DUF4874 domain-containing protein [Bacillota bacterium]